MTRAQRTQRRKTIHSWKNAEPLLQRWRRDLKTLAVEPVEREGKPTTTFRGQLLYITNADLTLRRPSGAILVIDRYEVIAVSDGKTRFEPR